MADDLPGLHDMLANLPRVKVTPENISQPTIDRWYRAEAEYRAEVERLRTDNEVLRIRAAGADSRNDILMRRIARVRQMAGSWVQVFGPTIRTAVAAEAIRTATEEVPDGG